MSDAKDDARARALKARMNLRRRARAVAFEAFEDAELRREEANHKAGQQPTRITPSPTGQTGGGLSAGRRKGLPSQRGK